MDFVLHPLRASAAAGAHVVGWRERRRQRALADVWIERGYGRPDGRFGWRVAELTSQRERKLYARSLRRLVDELNPHRLPGATPLNRAAIRPSAARLIAIAKRLEAFDEPVDAAGMLALKRLLTDPESPLYDRRRADEVGQTIEDVLDELEAH